jgi:general secretion pathway protein J
VTPKRIDRTATAGFTLVELLVAVTLVAVLTVALFGGLRFATRSTDAVGKRIDRTAQLALAYEFMERELGDAQALPASSSAPDAPVDFDGEAEGLSFVALPPGELGLGGFHWLHVALEGTGPARRLIVSWEALARGPEAEAASISAPRPSILLDGVKDVAFAYFGVQDPNRPLAWGDRWTERRALPQLIRLRVTLADGTRAPDLVVAPRLAGPPQP